MDDGEIQPIGCDHVMTSLIRLLATVLNVSAVWLVGGNNNCAEMVTFTGGPGKPSSDEKLLYSSTNSYKLN